MTTIAYRSGFLSADTQLSYETFRNGDREKLSIVDGWIVGMAGPTFLRESIERWIGAGCPSDDVPALMVEHDGDFDLLMMDADGSVYQYDTGFLLPVCAPYAAVGSGAMLALGAMAHPSHPAGADEAVMAAMAHDKNTGGNVQTLHHSILRS